MLDVLLLLAAAILANLLWVQQALAYVDPSVMTYTIQAVAGAAVALSAVLSVAFRRTRKVIFRVFKIDENAHKIVEPDVCAIDPDSPQASERLAQAKVGAMEMTQALENGRPAKELDWKRRFLRALLACLLLAVTFFIAPSLEIVAGGVDSLNFTYSDIFGIVVGVGLICAVGLALLVSLIHGKPFDVVITLLVALSVCGYVQALFLNYSLPAADGSALNLDEHMPITLLSSLIWIVLIFVLLYLALHQRTATRGICMILCLGLVIVQGASALSVNPGEEAYSETRFTGFIGSEGLFDLSAQNNIVVFVLDTYDTKFMEQVLEEDPHALDGFTGFTFFKNATSAMIPTRYGIPYLLSGNMPNAGDDFNRYKETRYQTSTFIPDIKEAGYDIGIYSDSMMTDHLTPYASNLHDKVELEINTVGILSALAKASLYRDAPWVLKPMFWFYTDQLNRSSLTGDMVPYTIDDPRFFDQLKRSGLALNQHEKSFRFIHLMGPHYPYVLDENGDQVPEDSVSLLQQARGDLHILDRYFNEMRRLNVYDNATIIVTADHGEFYWKDGPLYGPSSALLMVKPAETAEEAAAPLKVSTAPTGALDFVATVIDAAGIDRARYGPTVWEIDEDAERKRYYWDTVHNNNIDHYFQQYVIDGDALNFDDWERTGEEIYIEQHD